MKKSFSIRFRLISISTIAFSFFVLIIALTSYFLYSTNITNFTNTQMVSSSEQCLTNYDTYFDSAISISNNVQAKIDNIDIKQENENLKVTNYVDDLMSLKEEIINMAIYDEEANVIVRGKNFIGDSHILEKDWFKDAMEEPLINIFSRIDKSSEGTYAFTLSKYVTWKNSNHGILKIDLDFTEIVNLISQTNLGENGHVTIFDDSYDVVFTSLPILDEQEINAVSSLILGTSIANLNGVPYNLYLSTISKTGWKVAIFINYASVSTTLNSFLLILILCSVGVVLLFAFIFSLIATSLTRPIKQLQKEMAKIESLNYDVSLSKSIKGSREIEDLSRSFNQMMERIKELANRIIKEQEEQRKSELKALQNQINPHFLYNTLDSIIYLIDKKDNQKAEEMLIALSKFFRISISRGKTIIPLEKEIEHVKNYLLIQKLRYEDRFFYIIDVDKNLYKYNVIKLILQPIVENAIIHGLQGEESSSEITIKGRFDGDFIRLDIIDNGYGMTNEKIEEVYKSFKDETKHNGVGLKNVYQRLKIYYGEKADLKIYSELDQGTDIALFIPIEGAIKSEE